MFIELLDSHSSKTLIFLRFAFRLASWPLHLNRVLCLILQHDNPVRMGETEDAMEYDQDLIFKHL